MTPRRFLLSGVFVLLMASVTVAGGIPTELVNRLQASNVTVKAAKGEGSGTIFTRKIGSDTVSFVWTAGHVVDGLRTTREMVDPGTGQRKLVAEFADAQVVQEFQQDGRRVGEVKMEAKVIKYSGCADGEDLALLLIRKRNFTTEKVTTHFYLGNEIPGIGTELIHVGSLLGQFGSNSVTTGIISQLGRILTADGRNPCVFDQTSVVSFPGSSGGAVYNSGGEYVGMLTRGVRQAQGFNFIVPIRRMKDWAKRAGIEWALDLNVPMPSYADLEKLPVENTTPAPSPRTI